MAQRETETARFDVIDKQRLQLALDAGNIGTWEYDVQSGRLSWSDNFERVHGFARGSFGNSLETYQHNIHPDDRARVLGKIQDCALGGSDYSAEYRLIDPGGVTHYVEAHGRLLRNSGGKPERMIGICSEVSERRELLEKERRARLDAETNELQYRTLASSIPQQVWTATPDGQLDFVNHRTLEYFDRSFEEVTGAGWQSVIHPEDLPGVMDRWIRSLKTGEDYEVEFRLRRHDGTYRWHLGRAVPVRDPAGAILRWLGTNTDIDEKKKSLKLMSTQIDVAQLLVNARAFDDVAVPILEAIGHNLSWECGQMWTVDRDIHGLRRTAGWADPAVNRRHSSDLAAYDRLPLGANLPGRIVSTRAPSWVPDVQRDPNFVRASLLRSMGLRSAFGFPLIVGREVAAVLEFFSSEVRPVDESILTMTGTLGGQIGQFIGRQAAEERLSKALDQLSRLQSVTDVALTHLSLKDLLDRLLEKICETVDCDLAVVLLLDEARQELYPVATFGSKTDLSTDLRIAVGEGLSGRVAAQRTTMSARNVVHQEFIRPEIRNLGLQSLLGIPLLSRQRLVGVLMIGAKADREFLRTEVELADLVGNRVAIAIENSALYEKAREANQIKDRFLSIASHELRTPMTGILGWTELLKTETDVAIRTEALDWIEQSVRTQARLIEDLLDSTRIREGKLTLRKENVDLASILSSAVRIVTRMAADRGVLIDTNVEGQKTMVHGDPSRLQQIFWNLLSNAIKFTPAGKNVFVRLSVEDSMAVATVRDEGEGIAADFLPKMFKEFEQDEKGKQAGGLGLGLHIVSMIVRLHGGRIGAASDGPGRGATFTVRLPLASDPQN